MTSELSLAWLLHSRPYKESSVIAEFLIEDHGRVAMVVKGARKPRSTRAPLLQPFSQVMVCWRGKGELKTLYSIEPVQGFRLLRTYLYCGFYINELILRALMPGQSAEGLFELYSLIVAQLAEQTPVEPVLRFFELQLLHLTGYLPSFDYDVRSGQDVRGDTLYLFQPATGFIALGKQGAGAYDRRFVFHAEVLKALAARDFSNESYHPDFKRFSRQALAVLVGTRPLKSRELFIRSQKPATCFSSKRTMQNGSS